MPRTGTEWGVLFVFLWLLAGVVSCALWSLLRSKTREAEEDAESKRLDVAVSGAADRMVKTSDAMTSSIAKFHREQAEWARRRLESGKLSSQESFEWSKRHSHHVAKAKQFEAGLNKTSASSSKQALSSDDDVTEDMRQ